MPSPFSIFTGSETTSGAVLALRCYKHMGCIPAAAILGHHGGLQVLESNWRKSASRLTDDIQNHPESVTEADVGLLVQRFRSDEFNFPSVTGGLVPQGIPADDMLDTRMLFSALVDADFLETEAHFDGDEQQPRHYRPKGPPLDAERALWAIQEHVSSLQNDSAAAPAIANIRRILREACLAAAELPQGLFTLSAPTGSGKTLSMLAFALKHAAAHRLRRVVLVMPFLNIIDQTANLYRKLFSLDKGFPEGYVLEDHSLARSAELDRTEESESRRLRRLLSQNWDAPIVLTTSVQCLESLMSNKPSDCRKLHRLAESVLLFDEVQTLPRELAVATLATLSRLHSRFGATVVFATATQPAFEHLDKPVRKLSLAGWKPRSLLETPKQSKPFRAAARRTVVHWEHQTPLKLDKLAERLASEESDQLLCIVNLKRHAQRLVELLKDRQVEGVAHLSTSMCPLHRQRALDEIKERLNPDNPRPVRLISTQCIEAGVDIDFPVVYRALAPLEAIAQAAGRCNRHGNRSQLGQVHIFKPLDDNGKAIYPPGYVQASQTTETFVNRALARGAPGEALINDPEYLGPYFRDLYVLTGIGRDAQQREADLHQAMLEANFRKVAKLYRLMPSETINILVPYDRVEFTRLIEQIHSENPRELGFLRRWIAAARPLTVALYRPRPESPIRTYLKPIYFARRPTVGDEPDWYAAGRDMTYDELLGLTPPTEYDGII